MEEAIRVFAAVNFLTMGLSHIFQHRAWAEFFAYLHEQGRPRSVRQRFPESLHRFGDRRVPQRLGRAADDTHGSRMVVCIEGRHRFPFPGCRVAIHGENPGRTTLRWPSDPGWCWLS